MKLAHSDALKGRQAATGAGPPASPARPHPASLGAPPGHHPFQVPGPPEREHQPTGFDPGNTVRAAGQTHKVTLPRNGSLRRSAASSVTDPVEELDRLGVGIDPVPVGDSDDLLSKALDASPVSR